MSFHIIFLLDLKELRQPWILNTLSSSLLHAPNAVSLIPAETD
jgi:hypothetical protein